MLCFYAKMNMKNISGIINVNHFFEKLFEVFIPQKMCSHKVHCMRQAWICLKHFLHKLISLLSCGHSWHLLITNVGKVSSGIFHTTAVVVCHPHESGKQELFKHFFNKFSEIIFSPVVFSVCFWVTCCLQIKGLCRQRRISIWNVGI